MRGVSITDSTANGRFLSFDLVDILRLLEPSVGESEWEISGVECTGEAADGLQEVADLQLRISGKTLMELAANLVQTIDGEFIGYREGERHPWVVIRAVDSAAFDVLSADEEVMAKILNHFTSVAELPA